MTKNRLNANYKQYSPALFILLLISTAFQAVGQTTIWNEDFSGLSNGSRTDNGTTAWSTSDPWWADYWGTYNGVFRGSDVDDEAVWTSETIDISNYSNVTISILLGEEGTQEGSDYIRAYYRLNGGAEQRFANETNDFTSTTATINGLSGNTLQVIIKIDNNDDNEHHYFDDVLVEGTYNPCPTEVSAFPYSEGFESGLGDWSQETSDNIDWDRNNNGTPSGNTGPSNASEGFYYLYTEATNNNNRTAILKSPCFNLSGLSSPTFSFDYHMYGGDMGTLYLEIETTPGSNSWTTIHTINGNQGNNWQTAKLDLSAYTGSTIKIRFRGVTGNNYQSDIAIDNILLESRAPMIYVSSTTTQNTDNVEQGSTDAQIIGIEVVTSGVANPLAITSLAFNTTGSTNTTDISNAKIYYTGTSNTFATTSQLGGTINSPNGSFTINGSQQLEEGTNYFWLVYDVDANATANNVLDAQLNSITVGGSNQTPSITSPAGNRTITTAPVTIWYEDFEDINNWATVDNGATAWSVTTPNNADYWIVWDNRFLGGDLDGEAVWQSEVIDISNYSDITASIDLMEDIGDLDNSEYIRVYYKLDGGAEVLFGDYTNDFGSASPSVTNLNGSTLQIIVRAYNNTGDNQYYYFDNVFLAGIQSDMTYISSTVTQNTNSVGAGDSDQQVIGIEIVTENSGSPLDLTSLVLNTNGTTDAANDISNAKIYYTGTSSTYSLNSQFGTVVAAPNGTFTFNGTQTLQKGTNYFWLVYDVDDNAPKNNVIDAEATSLTISGSDYTPSVTAPVGNRIITRMDYVSSTVTQNTNDVAVGLSNTYVVGFEVVTANSGAALTLSSVNLNTNGSSNPTADFENAEIYYTAGSNTFATTTKFGSTVASPDGSFSINGTQVLTAGTNYFWVVVDIKLDATEDNLVDFEVTGLTLDGITYTPSITAPVGSRRINGINCGDSDMISSFPYIESFETDLGGWTQGDSDDFDWTRNTGGTMTNYTGPDRASNSDYYLYTESTSNTLREAILISPCLDMSSLSNPYFYFDYSMKGLLMGKMALEVQAVPGVSNWVEVWSRTGHQDDNWQLAKVDLSSYAGTTIKLRFRGTMGTGSTSDMAIDFVSLADKIIAVDPDASLTDFQEKITGTGVTIENLAITSCAASAFGTYSASSGSQIRKGEGIIMSTGYAADIEQMNRNDSWSAELGTDGNATLNNYTTGSTFDVCYIEFDVTPAGDTLSFNYTFASEEYIDYVGSEFNDVFAFLVSGPGITGEQNIAIIPNTTTPVAINNVNQNTNSEYFVNNAYYGNPTDGGGVIEDNTAFGSIEYDGFTINLVAKIAVQSCETYHIKWMIGDVGDRLWDSGVLIEGLNSNEIDNSVSTNEVYNSCTTDPVLVTFNRDGDISKELTLTPSYGGSMDLNTDYEISGLDNGLVKFSAGESTAQVVITATDSYSISTLDSVTISLTGCSGGALTTGKVYYKPTPDFSGRSEVLCFGEETSIDPGEYESYEWKNGANQIVSTDRVLQTGVAGNYTLTIRNSYGCEATTDPINIRTLSDLTLRASAQCQPVGINKTQVFVSATGAGGGYQYKLSTEPATAYTPDSIFMIDNNTTVQIDVKSMYGCTKTISVTTPTFTPGELADAGKQGQCILRGLNAFYHILDEDGNLIASINDLGNNLGLITAEVRIDEEVNSHNGEPYMQRNYKITPQFNGQAAKIRLYFTQTEMLALREKKNVIPALLDQLAINGKVSDLFHIAKYDGDTPGTANETFLSADAAPGGFKANRHYVEFVVPSFSSMYIEGESTLLPVKLVSFTASVKNTTDAYLQWETANETNNLGFEVQRSTDGYNFETIGFVKGNETTETSSKYNYIDKDLSGIYYYRLKQLDKDSSATITKVVSVQIKSNKKMAVTPYPNVFSETLNLMVTNATENNLDITIFDTAGKQILSQSYEGENSTREFNFDLKHLQTGIYIVKVKSLTESVQVKVVKE
ncbi:choice-of-anchor L domain-containing protein [Chondrinema litorale]|uniref:choice-of-anchor L domain-containing protein n=1 Tax=Chondrinema litorale TaxID=2994555 RepID=UPI0025434F28|nr:choice-of-anchor L domain-containing protein [Chondrinema litorale]UZR99265.1 choice-of-anchor L domain-containing protein [Chondrinema litorale]